jgi:predicted DNA-binding transcriptional regulator AlpA
MKAKTKAAPAVAVPETATSSIALTMPTVLADYLSPEQLALQLGVSERTVARWHAMRTGPPRVTLARRPLYPRASVAAWMARQEKDPAAASAGRRRRA